MINESIKLEDYHANIYLQILSHLVNGLPSIDAFIKQVEDDQDPSALDQLEKYYRTVMGSPQITPHILFEISQVYKPFYLRNPGPFDKSNSYYHLTLQLGSDSLQGLDQLYHGKLSRILKLYSHTFSKINHFFVDFQVAQLARYKKLIDEVSMEIKRFLNATANRKVLEKKEKLREQYLSRIPFQALFNVAHIDNLPSILQQGILSHNQAHGLGLVSKDISSKSVNDRRNRLEEDLDGNLHDYAPIYINPQNATFYYWCRNQPRTDVILFKINPNILLAPGVAFSDGNAAVPSTQFYRNIEDFNKLNWPVIKGQYWTDHIDGKRIKCAEVLIKDQVPLHYIDEIYVYDEKALFKVLPLFPNHLHICTRVIPEFYF